MSDTPPNMKKLPHLSEDLIWKIMVKADPKTVGQCRTLSKGWNFRLCTNLFVKANYKENKDRSKSVIVGIGYPPGDYNSVWFVRAYIQSGRQVQFNIPMDANQYGFYSVIGSENGIICIKISLGGLNSRLLIWNPVSDKRRYVTDEASKHSAHAISLYAFGFLEDEIEYRIVHVYKRAFRQRNMSWSLYTSFEREWTHSGMFESDVQKLGPKYIVNNGIVYWIGWQGADFFEPAYIVTFNLRIQMFHEAKIPPDVPSDYNSLTYFNDGVGYISYRNLAFSRQVLVWQMKRNGDHNIHWERMIRVSGLGIPYTPSLFVGNDIITVMECRGGSGSANDAVRTDFLISRLKYMESRREHLVHRTWQEHVNVKTITMHSDGLYMV
ncbi:hypothetical protein HN51_067711 [Arachis hypogaea]|uniref:F-box associated beta-propeller type 1 domain-containing protein n=1 Tax=Arachis hypogaea TaxID=3818 RepID=A0A444ZPZ1_ARAHY|nr:hypothetical protein Ahy_B04g073267 [Arachis hypogaea]